MTIEKRNTITTDQSTDDVLQSKDTCAEVQRSQILTILRRESSINTLDFRNMGFVSPAPRIKELRDMGYKIKTVRETVKTQDGRTHIGIARYYLSSEPPAINQPNSKGEAA